MYSLVSQIANIFANQSINTIENNDLSGSLVTGNNFSSVFEGLDYDNYPANFAALNGQSLPAPSYSPLALTISQFSLTAQSTSSETGLEISGDIIEANFTRNELGVMKSYASELLNDNSLGKSNYLNNGLFNSLNEPVKDSALNSIMNNKVQHLDDVQLASNTYNLRSSDVIEKSMLVGEQVKNSLTVPSSAIVTKDIINPSNVDNEVRLTSGQSYNDDIEVDKLAYLAVANKQDNINSVLASKQAATAQSFVSNTDTDIVSMAPSKQVTSTQLNQLNIVTDDLNESSSIITTRNDVLPKDSVANHINNLQVAQREQADAKVGAQINNLPKINTEDVVQKTVAENIDENIANKPIYNINQFNEIKRNELNTRNAKSVIDYQSSQSATVIDRQIFTNQVSNSEHINDVLSFTKGQEFDPLIKSQLNQSQIDKTLPNTLTVDTLSSTNKLLTPEKTLAPILPNSEVNNADEVAQQISWAKNHNANHVKIALSPEHLGALEINIEQDLDGLNIQFTTQNSLAKDAIETFMPRLKDMLEQQGLNLQNANVSQQNNGSNDNAYDQSSDHYGVNESEEITQNISQTTNSATQQSNSEYLLEAFA